MGNVTLSRDPYNLIITGVGGQGNVLASRIVGNMLMDKGFHVTIGETFGASQRGGSVMSHLRISRDSSFSPQIPQGKAHIVVALEPTEAIRVLRTYGSSEVCVLCNMRPIHSIGVISGEQQYPSQGDLEAWVRELSKKAWFVNATETALKMGNPIFGNIILLGALTGTRLLPLDRDTFESVLARTLSADKVETNLTAFDKGTAMIAS
jgi:indolepyruvate ferredoxin oxidoreductase beta subunit